MRWVLGLLVLGLFTPFHSFAQATRKVQKAASPHAAVASKSSAHGKVLSPASTRSAGPAKVTSARNAKGRRARGRSRVAGPVLQTHPDPERYRQIQQALAERGYFKGEANGEWGADSQEALTRFQNDRKFSDADGKITALTLRELGLGPKHDGSSMALSSRSSATAGASEIPSLNAPKTSPEKTTPEIPEPPPELPSSTPNQ